MRRVLPAAAWTATTALVILLARTIAYAVRPSPIAELLRHRAGGPALPALSLVALTAGSSLAIVITFLAWLGVREQALVERRPPPRLSVARMLRRAAFLWCAAAALGGFFEAYLHWSAGLGWHGLHCVVGPVHRDLLPIDAALSLVATAIATAVAHVVTWMRRTLQRLRCVTPYIRRGSSGPAAATPVLHVQPRPAARGPRGPPRLS
ncbi:MAG TPA: hypothetical protein VE269_02665 [Gaiellaceae bacterium]|nr:hypothetical protein [Gaiellaceae bacterium]